MADLDFLLWSFLVVGSLSASHLLSLPGANLFPCSPLFCLWGLLLYGSLPFMCKGNAAFPMLSHETMQAARCLLCHLSSAGEGFILLLTLQSVTMVIHGFRVQKVRAEGTLKRHPSCSMALAFVSPHGRRQQPSV